MRSMQSRTGMEMLLEAPFCAAAEWEVPVVTAWGCSCKGVRGGWLNGMGGFLLLGRVGNSRTATRSWGRDGKEFWEIHTSPKVQERGRHRGRCVGRGSSTSVLFPHPLLPP